MKTVQITGAANILRSGGAVLVPTETVVGLVAAESGSGRLSEIKRRNPQKPIALLCATRDEAFGMASEVSAVAKRLAERHWPGPLTLVLRRAGGGTIGLRVPDHEVVVELLRSYGGPLYATSANPAGEPPPAALEEVDPSILEIVDAAVEGESGAGEASAVVDLSGDEPLLLRANSRITQEELLRLSSEMGGNI